MTTQVDGPRLHLDVHQEVDDLTLEVTLDVVDQKPLTDVHHLDEGQIPEGQKVAAVSTWS